MNEELRELNMENDDVTMETNDSDSKSGLIGKLVVGSVIAGAGLLGAAIYKNRNKLEERRMEHKIKKMKKKGFTVIKPEKVEDDSEEKES